MSDRDYIDRLQREAISWFEKYKLDHSELAFMLTVVVDSMVEEKSGKYKRLIPSRIADTLKSASSHLDDLPSYETPESFKEALKKYMVETEKSIRELNKE